MAFALADGAFHIVGQGGEVFCRLAVAAQKRIQPAVFFAFHLFHLFKK
ncbi:hypothetical protein SDC9_208360 [bioreactor metagenome]|uniref:Uncharacterized protein n=1 Tax=bioreactor metagenome TaxID=1076179 RepID=A0A645JAJ1_9ZZZZ